MLEPAKTFRESFEVGLREVATQTTGSGPKTNFWVLLTDGDYWHIAQYCIQNGRWIHNWHLRHRSAENAMKYLFESVLLNWP